MGAGDDFLTRTRQWRNEPLTTAVSPNALAMMLWPSGKQWSE